MSATRTLVPSPDVEAWLNKQMELATVRRTGRLRWDFEQPEQEPGTLLPVGFTADSTWAQPGVVRSSCEDHKRPKRACTCGLYACLTLSQALERAGSDEIVGAIIAWGHLIIHGIEGFRAERARVVALSPPPKVKGLWAKLAAERLGVPCVPLHRLEEVGREFGNPIRWEYRFEDGS